MERNNKINIYVPQRIGELLEHDAKQFEIVKGDGYTINKNKFLSMLISGYYDTYTNETWNIYSSILDILRRSELNTTEDTLKETANDILEKIFLPYIPARKGKKPTKLSLKPTKEVLPIIKQFEETWAGKDYVSQFFCKMLASYCEKPLYRREQIVFDKNYSLISNACETGRPICFSTIWNKNSIHNVIPYKIIYSKEEMFNYLLCGERNKATGLMEARTYRLNRINEPNYGGVHDTIPEEVKDNLEMMIRHGPQFVIKDNETKCIWLSEEGIKSFNRIYYGRPIVNERKKTDEGWLLYFTCSEEQLYQYFKRFESYKYNVVSSIGLKERLIQFYETNKSNDIL